jgi:hypothetical protein
MRFSVPGRTSSATVAVLALTLGLSGCSSLDMVGAPSPAPPAAAQNAALPAPPPPPPPPQLPGGGRHLIPERRLVGFSGAPHAPALGPLTGDLDQVDQQLHKQATGYDQDKPIQPVYELIATRAISYPGPDGTYRARVDDKTVDEHLAAARAHGAILLLGIQPGRADFADEVRHYDRWLSQPDVGVALDPEWAVGPGEKPGSTFGTVTGAKLNEVADHLSEITRQYNLPQKPMIYHQLAKKIVQDEQQLQPHPDLAMVKSVDGIGSEQMKEATWRQLLPSTPPYVSAGFKLFYQEDARHGPLMTPQQVLALTPKPDYVLYE